MRQGNRLSHENISKGLTVLANWTVRIMGAGIFLVLAWYSFRYTQYMDPLGREMPLNVLDSMKRNVLFLGVAIAVLVGLYFLERYLSARMQRWIVYGFVILMALWVAGCGLWWITTLDRTPVGDQAFIYGGASYFIEGSYFYLEPRGYCNIYPHQLGLIFLTELLFRLVGTYNYFAFQFICVELAVASCILGFLLVCEMTDCMSVKVAYCLLMFGCLPLIFYTGWVYGEIPSIFLSLLTAYLLLRYIRLRHYGWLIGMVLAMTMAIVVRKNSLIVLIALCLVAGVWALRKMDKQLLIALLVAAILPSLVYSGIYKMYELRSGLEHSDGVSPISYIAMGMQEEGGKYGWFSTYCKDTYLENDCNTKQAAEISKQDIKVRLREFMENPSYALSFYREKILSQWNEPLYQSLFFGAQYQEGKEPEQGSLVSKLNNEYFVGILGICDRMQFILYIGMLCYFVFAVKKDSNILQHMLAVAVIGGFLFSIIWEAKARYIFPYYVIMFPLASVGYWQAIHTVQEFISRRRRPINEDNVIPFERVA